MALHDCYNTMHAAQAPKILHFFRACSEYPVNNLHKSVKVPWIVKLASVGYIMGFLEIVDPYILSLFPLVAISSWCFQGNEEWISILFRLSADMTAPQS